MKKSALQALVGRRLAGVVQHEHLTVLVLAGPGIAAVAYELDGRFTKHRSGDGRLVRGLDGSDDGEPTITAYKVDKDDDGEEHRVMLSTRTVLILAMDARCDSPVRELSREKLDEFLNRLPDELDRRADRMRAEAAEAETQAKETRTKMDRIRGLLGR
ncbi:MAG: hypothetical protein BWY99_02141 [Synergistetes bacterium ADurb.BinA166]|nr:MAG: hypothetical protein BWY99_02141 [Synergistetes bacterium ADurb.BinA166]